MTRHLWRSTCAVVLMGLLGGCGTDQTQMDRQALSAASAGHAKGATVHRGSDGYTLWWFWGDAEPDGTTFIAAVSSDPAFGEKWLCETLDPTLPPELDLTGWAWLDYRVTENASGGENSRFEGTLHSRVYRAVIPTDATYEELVAFLCALPTSAEAELLAWGTSEWKENVANLPVFGSSVGPGNSFDYFRVVGQGLTAPTWCPSAVARLAVRYSFGLAGDLRFAMDFACIGK